MKKDLIQRMLTVAVLMLCAATVLGQAAPTKPKPAAKPSATRPTVRTDKAWNIESDNVKCDGEVVKDGGTSVTEYGICWSKYEEPTIDNHHASAGSGTGTFTCHLGDLEPGMTYYYRAYATNRVGTSYGLEKSFKTKKALPTISTNRRQYLTSTSSTSVDTAKVYYTVHCGKGVEVTETGVYFSTSASAKENGKKTICGDGCGEYSWTLSGYRETQYYVWPYVVCKDGTVFGEMQTLKASERRQNTQNSGNVAENTHKSSEQSRNVQSCGPVTDYDGNTYRTVQIGGQCWMAENLRTTYDKKGESVSYQQKGSNIEYGLFYDWNVAQDICPNGWHLPSKNEWMQLIDYVESQSQYLCDGYPQTIAKALASKTGWVYSNEAYSVGNNPNLNNSTNFNLFPAGYSEYDSYYTAKANAYLWSSTKVKDVFCFCLNYSRFNVLYEHMKTSVKLPVRCLRNEN